MEHYPTIGASWPCDVIANRGHRYDSFGDVSPIRKGNVDNCVSRKLGSDQCCLLVHTLVRQEACPILNDL
jgi:hypothetical protein